MRGGPSNPAISRRHGSSYAPKTEAQGYYLNYCVKNLALIALILTWDTCFGFESNYSTMNMIIIQIVDKSYAVTKVPVPHSSTLLFLIHTLVLLDGLGEFW